jgi:tetratricopeptide (TPR) repeat protein
MSFAQLKNAELDCLQAIEIFEELKTREELSSAYNLMTLILGEQGNTEKRQVYIDKTDQLYEQIGSAVELSQKRIDFLFNETFLYHQQGDLNLALKGYNDLVELLQKGLMTSPHFRKEKAYFQTYWHRADILASQGHVVEAIRDYEEALSAAVGSHNPDFSQYANYLSVSLLELKAKSDPLASAKHLDLAKAEYLGKSATLVKMAAIYCLAAKSVTELDEKKSWIDLAFNLLFELRSQDLFDDEVRAALMDSSEFALLHEDSRWEEILSK